MNPPQSEDAKNYWEWVAKVGWWVAWVDTVPASEPPAYSSHLRPDPDPETRSY